MLVFQLPVKQTSDTLARRPPDAARCASAAGWC